MFHMFYFVRHCKMISQSFWYTKKEYIDLILLAMYLIAFITNFDYLAKKKRNVVFFITFHAMQKKKERKCSEQMLGGIKYFDSVFFCFLLIYCTIHVITVLFFYGLLRSYVTIKWLSVRIFLLWIEYVGFMRTKWKLCQCICQTSVWSNNMIESRIVSCHPKHSDIKTMMNYKIYVWCEFLYFYLWSLKIFI